MTPVIVSQEARRTRVRRAVEHERIATGLPRHAFSHAGHLFGRVTVQHQCPDYGLDGARCVRAEGHPGLHLHL